MQLGAAISVVPPPHNNTNLLSQRTQLESCSVSYKLHYNNIIQLASPLFLFSSQTLHYSTTDYSKLAKTHSSPKQEGEGQIVCRNNSTMFKIVFSDFMFSLRISACWLSGGGQCAVELQTNVREDFTISEKTPTLLKVST